MSSAYSAFQFVGTYHVLLELATCCWNLPREITRHAIERVYYKENKIISNLEQEPMEKPRLSSLVIMIYGYLSLHSWIFCKFVNALKMCGVIHRRHIIK